MTKIKFSKNFFVAKICVAMQPRTCVRRPACQWLWYRHNEEREHGKIFAVALQHGRGGLPVFAVSVSVSVLFTANALVLNVSS